MDNRCRFDGTTDGHYEVWFVTLNDPATGWGFWFRYAIDVKVGSAEPKPSLWASVFPNDGTRPFGIARRFDTEAWRPTNERANLVAGIGDGELRDDRLVGAVSDEQHRIAWDLLFDPAVETFHHIDPFVRKAVRPKTIIYAPNLSVPFFGWIDVDDRRFDLKKAPGCQQHLWGSKHAEGWAWAHCTAFNDEPDAVFEAFSATTHLGPLRLPALTLAYLKYGGEEFVFNHVPHLMSARSRTQPLSWTATTGDATTRLLITAHTEQNRFLQVDYPDPDGEVLYCLNTEIGDLEVTVERRDRRSGVWNLDRRLVSSGTTHFELASRSMRPEIPLISRVG